MVRKLYPVAVHCDVRPWHSRYLLCVASGFQTGVPGYLETEKSSSSLNLNLNLHLHYHYQGSGDCQMSTLAMRHFVPLWRFVDIWAQFITGIILCMRPANERRETVQWETVQCNVVSHWLGAYTKWSLHDISLGLSNTSWSSDVI